MMPNSVTYTPELMDRICEMVAGGMWLTEIASLPGMPTTTAIVLWRNKFPDAAAKYEAAITARTETMQDTHKDMIEKCDKNQNAIRLLELHIKTDMWYMEKIFPKKFGARTIVSGDKDNPIEMSLAKSLDQKIAEAREKKTIEHIPMRMPVVDVQETVE